MAIAKSRAAFRKRLICAWTLAGLTVAVAGCASTGSSQSVRSHDQVLQEFSPGKSGWLDANESIADSAPQAGRNDEAWWTLDGAVYSVMGSADISMCADHREANKGCFFSSGPIAVEEIYVRVEASPDQYQFLPLSTFASLSLSSENIRSAVYVDGKDQVTRQDYRAILCGTLIAGTGVTKSGETYTVTNRGNLGRTALVEIDSAGRKIRNVESFNYRNDQGYSKHISLPSTIGPNLSYSLDRAGECKGSKSFSMTAASKAEYLASLASIQNEKSAALVRQLQANEAKVTEQRRTMQRFARLPSGYSFVCDGPKYIESKGATADTALACPLDGSYVSLPYGAFFSGQMGEWQVTEVQSFNSGTNPYGFPIKFDRYRLFKVR